MAVGRRISVLADSQTPNTGGPYCLHQVKEKKGRQRGNKYNERIFSPLSLFHVFLYESTFHLDLLTPIFFAGESRQLAFPSAFFFAYKRLKNNAIRTINVLDKDVYEPQCYKERNIVSALILKSRQINRVEEHCAHA